MNRKEQIIEFLTKPATIIISTVLLLICHLPILGNSIKLSIIFLIIFLCGLPLFIEAVEDLKSKIVSANFLITLAIFSSIFIKEYMAAAEVAVIMAIGEALEEYTLNKSKHNINALLSLKPQKAWKIIETNELSQVNLEKLLEVDIEDIKVGDKLRVKPGEIIPLDGIVLKGSSSVNQAIVTGESLPILKEIGSEVYAGTINNEGVIDIECTASSKDSTVAKMIELMEQVNKDKAPLQRLADKWASKIVFMSITFAVLTYFYHFQNGLDSMSSLTRAVTILLVFCPCAFVLATPTAIIAAIGQASKKGIFIKSGKALEKLAKIDTIFFDKTGTLTQGDLSVLKILNIEDQTSFAEDIAEKELLKKIASLELNSEHPIAKAILTKASENSINDFYKLDNFENHLGLGVSGSYHSQNWYLGNKKMLEAYDIKLTEYWEDLALSEMKKGKIIIFFAEENQKMNLPNSKPMVKNIIILGDEIRNESSYCIDNFKKYGVKSILLTGDQKNTANFIADSLNIHTVMASCLPKDKVNYIKDYQDNGHKCLMIGDGINDAPALKTAEVGIALGKNGNEISMDAADLTLMGNDLNKITYAYNLAKSTVKSIKMNMTLAMVINLIAVILSFMGILGPSSGALFHNIGSILVILNASFLYNRDISEN